MTTPTERSGDPQASSASGIHTRDNAHPPSLIRRYPIACFLLGALLIIVALPFCEMLRAGDLLEAILMTALLLSALPAMGRHRRTLIFGIVLITPAVAGKWLNHWWPAVVPLGFFIIPSLLYIAFLIFHLMRYILRRSHVDSEVLCAAIAGYLLLGLLWSMAYMLAARLVPGAFAFAGADPAQAMKGFTAIYFSFITLCTVGYGDIVPVHGVARMLVTVEAICGTFYIAILISRLVAMYSLHPPKEEPPD